LKEYDPSNHGNASDHYDLLWWNNADKTLENVPKDAFWTWGLYDSLTVVIPSLDIVIARAGKSWERTSDEHYAVLAPFFDPIVASVVDKETSQQHSKASAALPYPNSTLVKSIQWAPVDAITYQAQGSDNWPLTWADDDNQYTAYGDGWGFESKVKNKLSMGFARISGAPNDYTATNIRSKDEQTGQGRLGRKASSLLCVNGVLYAWARNANYKGQQSTLAWSVDYAKNWTWADWVWEEFGYPVFVNFGKNYSGLPDDLQGYAYFYSPDSPDAYNETDSVILARAPLDTLTKMSAYEFYVGQDGGGNPIWNKDSKKRSSVFDFPGGCNRLDVTYNAGLQRFMMTMRSRKQSGGLNQFSIYDAPNLWGPWTTIYYTETWDENGKQLELSDDNKHWGEVAHIPSKWISEDGLGFYLVFAGDDSFAVRKATMTLW
ncbi:DUF4185 domain-containing protein, partial [bacterium]|nr:DUF4185 domain-containing protein [bacterium]